MLASDVASQINKKFDSVSGNGKKYFNIKLGRFIGIASVGLDAYEIYEGGFTPRVISKVAYGWAGAYVGATIGGGGALVGGQMGPQVALPEEIATVPIGAIIGGIAGGMLGSEISEVIYEFISEEKGFKQY